jgi:hypothetical protein
MQQIKDDGALSDPATSTTSTVAVTEFTAAPHEPVTAEDRHEQKILEEAARLGYRLATRCSRCGQWVVARTSVRLHMGPVCRAKAVD